MGNNPIGFGRLLIHMYLPSTLIPDIMDDLDFDEFYNLMALADYARELKIQDIEAGVAKGIADCYSDT